MKAYKATYNFKCKDLIFEIGKTYIHEGELIICKSGLHFCKNPDDLFTFYSYQSNLKILEIEVLGDVIDDIYEGNKSVTNKLKVLREIPFNEWNDLFTEYTFTKKSNRLEIKTEYSYGFWKKCSYDENNNKIKTEYSYGFWEKSSYDENGNKIYYEDSEGYWYKFSYDEKGNKIKFENSNGYWKKWFYDDKNNLIQKDIGESGIMMKKGN